MTDNEQRAPSREELSARRSNRRTLIVFLLFVLVLGLLPLAVALLQRLG